MDYLQVNIWCWIIPLLVGAICAYLGFLMGRKNKRASIYEAELILLQEKNHKLKDDLDACAEKLSDGSKDVDESDATLEASAIDTGDTPEPFDAAKAQAAMGKVVQHDDLKIVEGIGPKIAGMFKENGIASWKELSEVAVAKCHEVLEGGGDRYKIHDPASWPMQAKMAYEGKWKELAKWQHKHKHGKL